jgi:Fe2+ transport system protein B
LARDVIDQKSKVSTNLSDRIDRVMLNRALGIPIFLLAMYLMFMFTINIGGAFIDLFDIFAGTLFVDGFAEVPSRLGSPEWLTLGLASGIGGGIQVEATFIPIIAALFAAAFFLVGGQNIVFGLYLIGIAAAVVTGLIMKTTLLQGESTPFVMELPPYHLPTCDRFLPGHDLFL